MNQSLIPRKNPLLIVVVIWVILSTLPMIPFTFSLFQQSLSNSPTAYLIWVPMISFCWAAWNLHGTLTGGNDANRKLWLAFLLSAFTGTFMCIGAFCLSDWFFSWSIGLLIWPLWSLSMFWFLNPLRLTRVIVKPLIFMFVVWPPFYIKLIATVNPVLSHLTTTTVGFYSSFTPWMHTGTSADLFDVLSGSKLTTVYVSNSCSGSDSILALLVLFPITLVLYRTRPVHKLLLVVLGCVLAFVFNVLRICLILTSLHFIGYWVTFKILHPILGSIFFVILVIGLIWFGSKRAKVLSHPQVTVFKGPGSIEIKVAIIISLLVTAFLSPLYGWSNGSVLKPLFLTRNNLHEMMPNLSGYHLIDKTDTDDANVVGVYEGINNTKLNVKLSWLDEQNKPKTDPTLGPLKIVTQHPICIRTGIRGRWLLAQSVGSARRSSDEGFEEIVYSYRVVYHARRYNLYVELYTPRDLNKSEMAGFQNTSSKIKLRNSQDLLTFQSIYTDALLRAVGTSGLWGDQ